MVDRIHGEVGKDFGLVLSFSRAVVVAVAVKTMIVEILYGEEEETKLVHLGSMV